MTDEQMHRIQAQRKEVQPTPQELLNLRADKPFNWQDQAPIYYPTPFEKDLLRRIEALEKLNKR